MALVFLSLGSNLGNRQKNLNICLDLLERHAGKVVNSSSAYKYKPWGYSSDNLFLNMVSALETDIRAEDLLGTLKKIEEEMGRVKSTNGYADRLIDIDILFYNSDILNTTELTIPHPLIQERAFVLEPMNEIAPDFIHPVLKTSIKSLFIKLTLDQDKS